MNNLKEILLLPPSEFMEAYMTGGSELFQTAYAHVNEPKFRAGQTGISRRDINVWRREGLLPNSLEESTWSLFSITECVWLRFVSKLKKFNFPNKAISEIKDYMFSQEPNILKDIFNSVKALPHLLKETNQFVTELEDKLNETSLDEIRSELKKINYSLFATTVMNCCQLHINLVFYINEDFEHFIMNAGKPLNEQSSLIIYEAKKQIDKVSYLAINIYELCKDFFENEAVIIDTDFYFALMNQCEQDVLKEIRSGKYKEITIKVDNATITQMRLTKNDNENEQMIRKLSRLFKTNDFKNIELITRDGHIVKYSETDIVKMNK